MEACLKFKENRNFTLNLLSKIHTHTHTHTHSYTHRITHTHTQTHRNVMITLHTSSPQNVTFEYCNHFALVRHYQSVSIVMRSGDLDTGLYLP